MASEEVAVALAASVVEEVVAAARGEAGKSVGSRQGQLATGKRK